jgi:hypothetical protein
MHLRPCSRMLLSSVLAFAIHVTAGTPPPSAIDITYTDVPPAQVELFDWALGLFAESGLALPPVDVVGHRTEAACLGRRGAHWHEHGRSRIHLCTSDSGPLEEFMVLHELGHAWDRHALSPARRDAFLALRGLSEWRNGDPDRWLDRGAEHAAEIIAWGVIDRPVRILRLHDNSCADLLIGYLVLTGTEPVHGHTEACRADDP